MTSVDSCRIESLDREASMAWLDWVLGNGASPIAFGDPAWLLCHADDGVTWGRLERGAWKLGSTAFPDLCPVPFDVCIQELRVFSREAEVLLWRMVDGLRGRILRDGDPGLDDGPTRPADEERLLLGDHVGEHKDGFTRVGDGTGAEQALPLRARKGPSSSWPRLCVRHYFARDAETGGVRVVATRLVEVK